MVDIIMVGTVLFVFGLFICYLLFVCGGVILCWVGASTGDFCMCVLGIAVVLLLVGAGLITIGIVIY